MEKVSAKMFFTVMWRGVCQALGWFFGLFGYKRDGKFAKCVWGLFATIAAVVMLIVAGALVCFLWDEVGRKWWFQQTNCGKVICSHCTPIKNDIYFHDSENDKGYIFNIRTGKKLVKHVAWISMPMDKDSLVCFSNGKKRGYFSKNTGRVVVEPKYDRAWVFSEGLACVEDAGAVKFIDGTGKVVIDKNPAIQPNMDGYMFHGGFCVVNTDDELYGLMDKTGRFVLPLEYDLIEPKIDFRLWLVKKGDEMGVIDQELRPVVPLTKCTINLSDETIDVTMPDHTIRKYDLHGELINDFYITGIRMLEYEKDEIVYQKVENGDNDSDVYEYAETESYHPKATARLRAYVAGDGYEGLMNAEGHVVVMPLYKNITAIGNDLYLCNVTDYDNVIVNGKGEVVK